MQSTPSGAQGSLTTKGHELSKAVTDTECDIVSTGNPTNWATYPRRTPDLIDFCVVKIISTNYIKS
jgi:hypothetical protein